MPKTLDQIEEELRAVTDQVGRIMDRIQQKGYVPAFRCGHSGLLLPSNYVKDWGRDGIGIGLGPDPVSEVFDSLYDVEPSLVNIRSLDDIMHPLQVTRAQVDLVMVAPEDLQERSAVLARDDRHCVRRAGIVRARQLQNPHNRIASKVAAAQKAMAF